MDTAAPETNGQKVTNAILALKIDQNTEALKALASKLDAYISKNDSEHDQMERATNIVAVDQARLSEKVNVLFGVNGLANLAAMALGALGIRQP